MKKALLLIINFLLIFYAAKVHAQSWSQVDAGLLGQYPQSMAVFNNNLYVGGIVSAELGFSSGIVKWDGANWSTLGSGLFSSTVSSLGWYNGKLIVGGQITTAGDMPVNNIASWDGANWSPLGQGIRPYGFVNAMVVYNNELYVGGSFDTAGTSQIFSLAKWNGSSWSSTGAFPDETNEINSLVVYNGELYASGSFGTVAGTPAQSIAKWNGSSWSVGGLAVNGQALSMAVYNGSLYVAGHFSIAGSNVPVNNIARWNGSSWSAVSSGLNEIVFGLAVHNNELVAIGEFTTAGGIPAHHIAKWNGTTWSALGPGGDVFAYTQGGGEDNGTYSLASFNGDLFARGNFYSPDTILIPHLLGRWTNCPIPFATIHANPSVICSGASSLMSANVAPGMTYQWKRNTLDIPGATSSTYSTTTTGSYSCVEQTSCGTAYSNVIALDAGPAVPPTPGQISGTNNACANATDLIYSISPVNGATAYIWQVPATATIASGQGTTSISVNFSNFNGGFVRVRSINDCGTSSLRSKHIGSHPGCDMRLAVTDDGLNVSAYPNPSSGSFTIHISSSLKETCNLIIRDITGREIERMEKMNTDNDMSFGHHFPAGVYFLEVIQGESKQMLRLIRNE